MHRLHTLVFSSNRVDNNNDEDAKSDNRTDWSTLKSVIVGVISKIQEELRKNANFEQRDVNLPLFLLILAGMMI